MKKHINILFLDEVFSSIDITSIYDVLRLLKEFAHEYKINVFLIHHAILEKSYFDKILRIEKNVTSNIIYE
jgi:ABC-type Mn2+/Zn2+ transport system ATPase subunit